MFGLNNVPEQTLVHRKSGSITKGMVRFKKKKKKKHIHTTGCNTTLKTNEAELHTLTKKNVHDYKVIKTSCRITDVA